MDGYLRAVTTAIYQEMPVVVSPLTELEASVQMRGMYLGGTWSAKRFARMRERLAGTIASDPFVRRELVSGVFSAAIEQHKASNVHCRSLDRLHLAAMAELGVTRLMTHDGRQAEAAQELGYEVLSPGLM